MEKEKAGLSRVGFLCNGKERRHWFFLVLLGLWLPGGTTENQNNKGGRGRGRNNKKVVEETEVKSINHDNWVPTLSVHCIHLRQEF